MRKLLPGKEFWLFVHCDLDLGDMTLCRDHDTTLGHGQQLCEILSDCNKELRSFDLDKVDGKTG